MNDTNDEPTTDDKIKATVAVKAWRFYKRNKTPVTVDVLAQQGISTDNRGRAKELIRSMADRDDAPLAWDRKDLDRVSLDGEDEEEKAGWVRSWALRHVPDRDLPWNLK